MHGDPHMAKARIEFVVITFSRLGIISFHYNSKTTGLL